MPLDASHGIGLAGMTLQMLPPNMLVTTFDSSTGSLPLSWSRPGELQETSDLTSPIVWPNVPGVVGMSNVIAVGDASRKFYRLLNN